MVKQHSDEEQKPTANAGFSQFTIINNRETSVLCDTIHFFFMVQMNHQIYYKTFKYILLLTHQDKQPI
jgi:hypothetical protein